MYQRNYTMQPSLKNIGVAALAALSIVTATVATSSSANAQRFHGGWHGGHHRGWGFGPAVVGGLALGALAAPYAWAPGYYYDECAPQRRVVGYTPWGRSIVRFVRVCY